jgi:2-polyprenyl-3-methyl-5-hydroxy-6-metoxy-1,4-benzoquinol methylase
MRLAVLFNRDIRGLDIQKTVFLSPDKIVYCSLREFNKYSVGAVMGGDWDKLEKRFEDLDVYVAFKQVLLEGKDWRETVYYQRIVDALNTGQFLWGCANEGDLLQRCQNLETLFHTIKREGYKTQRSLRQSQSFVGPTSIDDEVTVSIGRDGDFLFSNGAHRLTIAKLLSIKQIPVRIAVRHREWMAFRKELLEYAKSLGGKLYQPATHPDLMDIPASHKCEDEFLMIREKISVRNGRLLDLGANLGYFCHRFEDEGFECYAVEEQPKELYFLRKLRRAENRKFKVVAGSIFDWAQVSETYFDIVLTLKVFHYALKKKESFYTLVALLQNLQMGELFISHPNEGEPQMKGVYKNYSLSEFVNFIMQISTLKQVEVVGKSDDRAIYRLYR